MVTNREPLSPYCPPTPHPLKFNGAVRRRSVAERFFVTEYECTAACKSAYSSSGFYHSLWYNNVLLCNNAKLYCLIAIPTIGVSGPVAQSV